MFLSISIAPWNDLFAPKSVIEPPRERDVYPIEAKNDSEKGGQGKEAAALKQQQLLLASPVLCTESST